MRVFVAFDLAIPVVENLVLLQEDLTAPLRSAGAKPRWPDAANIHLTVRFIGEVDDALVMRIREQLRLVAARTPKLALQTRGTGCFPDARQPRIIWAGAGDGSEAVVALQKDVEEALSAIGVAPDERPFFPHVTVGRVRTPTGRVDAESMLRPYADTDFGTSQIKDIILLESRLGPKGAEYRVIERFPLGAA